MMFTVLKLYFFICNFILIVLIVYHVFNMYSNVNILIFGIQSKKSNKRSGIYMNKFPRKTIIME